MKDDGTRNFRQLEAAPTIAAIDRLQTDRRYRDAHRLFFAEGVRNFVAAVDHQFPIHSLVYSERLLIHPLARKLVRRLKREGVPFARLSPEQFRAVSKTERASGIGLVLRHRLHCLGDIKLTGRSCWTALNSLRSPGNFGSLVRTSAATGAEGFILLSEAIDPFDPAVVRASMGALFKQLFVRTTPEEFGRWVKSRNVDVIGASPAGTAEYHAISYRRPAVLMLGGERKGLSEEQRILCRQIVKIPMVDGVDSLNVAVAGGLLLYEVFRSSR